MPLRDPEPPEGDYYDGLPENEPEADDWEPPTCPECGTVHDDWDRRCNLCGAPLGWYAIYREADLTPIDPAKAPF